ncbi:MAG: TRAP transporter substrate-binding protein DctP [Dehalococcoidia bacterium]|nr:TRAP transporter substrate-binding protein DctP [Dehalococcoidia bacterium]
MKGKIFNIVLALSLLAGAGISGCKPTPDVIKWRMTTSWSSDMLFYTESAKAICDRVAELSGGRLVLEAYPADSIAGALEVFDAVSKGEVQCGHTWPGYWCSNKPSFELFSSIPNQMVQQEWVIWLYGPPRGIDLWQELYAQYNVMPFPGGLIGPEFGFFTNKPVQSLSDFKGLKLRVSGMAAGVVEELGATTILVPAEEIRSAMARGDIDGFEFSTPAVDWPLGFEEIAPYVVLPCWHQPSAMLETIVNRDAWNQLPDDLKAIFEAACKETSIVDFMAHLEGTNAEYLKKFEQYGTELMILDTESMLRITEITDRLADEQAAKDPFYARVLKSQRDFREGYRTWEKWGDYKLYPD